MVIVVFFIVMLSVILLNVIKMSVFVLIILLPLGDTYMDEVWT
jgi:hypothetical protein